MSADLFCQLRQYCDGYPAGTYSKPMVIYIYVSLFLICMMHAHRACNIHVRLKRLLQTARVHRGCLVVSRDATLDCNQCIYDEWPGYSPSMKGLVYSLFSISHTHK